MAGEELPEGLVLNGNEAVGALEVIEDLKITRQENVACYELIRACGL